MEVRNVELEPGREQGQGGREFADRRDGGIVELVAVLERSGHAGYAERMGEVGLDDRSSAVGHWVVHLR